MNFPPPDCECCDFKAIESSQARSAALLQSLSYSWSLHSQAIFESQIVYLISDCASICVVSKIVDGWSPKVRAEVCQPKELKGKSLQVQVVYYKIWKYGWLTSCYMFVSGCFRPYCTFVHFQHTWTRLERSYRWGGRRRWRPRGGGGGGAAWGRRGRRWGRWTGSRRWLYLGTRSPKLRFNKHLIWNCTTVSPGPWASHCPASWKSFTRSWTWSKCVGFFETLVKKI